jgi:signal peptidase I
MTAVAPSPALLVLSDDVQDLMDWAEKRFKAPAAHLSDTQLLNAVLKYARWFSRPDAVLKQLGLAPRAMKKAMGTPSQPSAPTEYNALVRAKDWALQTSLSPQKPRLSIEHLIYALSQSAEPAVQAAFALGAQITPEKWHAAVAQVEAQTPFRWVAYALREGIEVVLVVTILLIAIKQGLGELRLIPSESMVPTLQVGDRLVVEKLSLFFQPPQRGDILVFYPPEPESVLKHDAWSTFLRLTGFNGIVYDKDSKLDRAFIKRLIGLPGDVINVVPGKGVWVNGRPLNEPYTAELAQSCTFIQYCGPIKVPAGMYYMMGDNRNESADSRYWAFLPKERVIGKAVMRFFPIDSRFGLLRHPVYP